MSTVRALRPSHVHEVAAHLQRRLSALGLAVEALIDAAEFLARINEQLRAGFPLNEEDRCKLATLALVCFDAREVLGSL